MDKRTILFVLALSLSLFGVNLFFQYQNVQKKQEWVQQQQIKQAQKEKRQQEDIAQRTAQPDSLPLVRLYKDAQEQEFLHSGVFNNKSILTLSWTSPLPEFIFAQSPVTGEMEKYQLTYQQTGLGAPAIYQAQSSSLLKIGALPENGHYDLQLITFNEQDDQNPVGVSLGEYSDNQLTIPADTAIKEAANKMPPRKYSAIAVLKTGQGYLPVGLYDSTQHGLIPLSGIEKLSPHLEQTAQAPTRPTKKAEQKFYVIETPYQQLVFSNYGGALAEINLPFPLK